MENHCVLYTFVTATEANLAKAYLESQGLEVTLKDELTAQVMNFVPDAIGGIKIMIKELNYEEGFEALKAGGFISANAQSALNKIEAVTWNKNTNKKICPFCQSKNIGRKSDSNLLNRFVYHILGILFPEFKRSYTCFDCKKEWRYVK